jgi:hypothetical protein
MPGCARGPLHMSAPNLGKRIALIYEHCITGPTQTMDRCNAVSNCRPLFKVRAFAACLPCGLIGREARKRQTSSMQQTPP